MAEKLASKELMTTMMGVIEKTLATMSGVVATSPAESKEVDIEEYEGRMRLLNMHDFESSMYIGVVNYYLTKEDMDREKAKGVVVLYIDTEYASKLYKALNFPFPDDEDDASMLNGCGEFCKVLATSFKDEISKMGFVDLIMGTPQYFKNSVMDGVAYSPDQHQKYQFNFFFWKRRAITLELSLGDLPSKR